MDHDAAPSMSGDQRRAAVLAGLERHLRQLREQYGNPGFATMAQRIVHQPDVAGSKNVFNGLVKSMTAVPREDVLRGFARALDASDGETGHLIKLRRAAVQELSAIDEDEGVEPVEDGRDRDGGELAENRQDRDGVEPHDRAAGWHRRPVLAVAAVLGSLIAVAALIVVVTSSSTPPEGPFAGPVTTGEVSCQSGAYVVGVYIAAPGVAGRRGFASWNPGPEPSKASYVFTLPRSLTYSVHVGCGGTREDWAVDSRSPGHSGPTGSFICMDDEAIDRQQEYGRCAARADR